MSESPWEDAKEQLVDELTEQIGSVLQGTQADIQTALTLLVDQSMRAAATGRNHLIRNIKNTSLTVLERQSVRVRKSGVKLFNTGVGILIGTMSIAMGMPLHQLRPPED